MPFTLIAQLATLCKQTHSARALILPISLHITISPVPPPVSWSAGGRGGGGLGVGFRQLPYRDLCLTSHLTPTTPPRAGALGSLLEPWLNPRFPSQHNTLIFMEIWRGTFQTHYQRFVHNQGSAEFYARQSSQQISTFRRLHYGFFFLSLSLSLFLHSHFLTNLLVRK